MPSSAPATYTSLDGTAGPVPVPALPADVPAGLVARFRENADWFNFGGPIPPGVPYAQFDGPSNWPAGLWRGATGTVGDRRAGKDLPQFWSELDLRGYRVMSRWLWDTNPFMIGFGARLVDYHVGKGYQWQACLKGQKKQPYATSEAARESEAGKLTTKAQNILDAWRDGVNWPLRSREGFKRLRRDGEVGQRFFCGERGSLPEVRWVNAEQIGSPTGDSHGPDSYGVRTRPDDTEHVTAVFVRDHDGDGLRGEWVNADRDDPAARVVFFKTNTDGDVKRGLPDSFSLHEGLDECRKLVRNMVIVAAAQAAIAWREKFPTASAEQVRALIPTSYPRPDVPGYADGSGNTVYSDKMAAGTVLRTEGSREFEAGPVSTGVGSYVEAEQACLRMACVRWGFPPYMTAKADDINFASSLTAGSPFAVAVEGGQVEWGCVERATALKVLDLAAEAGLLTWEERRRLDVEVIPPSVTSPDKKADTDRLLGLLREKVVDPYTVQQELGYDPSHIAANWKAWEERRATGAGDEDTLRGTLQGVSALQQLQTAVAGGQLTADAAVANLKLVFGLDPKETMALFPPKPPTDLTPDGQGPDEMPDPSLIGGGLAEGVVRENFTGVITDAAGHKRHYVDGKQVAAPDEGGGGGRQEVGQGNTGKVYRDGDEVVKSARLPDGTETREGEFYEALRGVEGVAPGRREGDEIRLPHYQEVLSVDTVPDERDRKSMGSVVGAQKVRLLNAANAMGEAGIDYNDPLQVGFDDDYTAHVIDLSNAGRVDPKTALRANIERTARFLEDFGAEKTADDIRRTFGVYNFARSLAGGSAEAAAKRIDNLVARGNNRAVEHVQSIGPEKLAGYDVRHVYYASNPRPVERPGILQSEPDGDGLKVILTDKPLDADTIRQYQLTPVVHPATRKPAAESTDLSALIDAALARLAEAAGLVPKTIQVHNSKTGKTYRRTVMVHPDEAPGGDAEPGGDDAPALPRDHVLAGLAGKIAAADPEAAKDPALVARLSDRALTAAAKAYGVFVRLTPAMMTATKILEGVFDTPEDMQRFGYNPSMTSQTANPGVADPVKDATGVSAHLAATVASHVLGRAWVAATKRLAGKAAEADGVDALAELLREAVAHVAEEFGLPEPPSAEEMAAAMRAGVPVAESVGEDVFDALVTGGVWLAEEIDAAGRTVVEAGGLVPKTVTVHKQDGSTYQTTVMVRHPDPSVSYLCPPPVPPPSDPS